MTDVTVTPAEEVSAGALIWEASDDGAQWDAVPMTHTESLIADRTTPFALTRPVTARMLRVRAAAPLALNQLELFDLGGEPAQDMR